MMSHDWSRNLAPDGYFVDLYDDTVRPLQTAYGFDAGAFDAAVPTTVYPAPGLTSAAIQAAINTADAAGGGIVRLPAGAGTMTAQINLKSKVLLEGAGANSTILTWNKTTGSPFYINDKANVVIRDFFLDCGNLPIYGINFEYAQNVLVERVRVKAAKNGNIRFRFVNGGTIRYSEAWDCRDYHGIAIKDIFEGGALVNEAFCNSQFAAGGATYGSKFTQNYSLYSNHCHHNGGNGINAHSINGEIAGNLSEYNQFGGKSYDGLNVILHHNTFRNSVARGWALAATIVYTGRTVGNLTFCNNRFIDNGGRDLEMFDTSALGSWTYTGEVRLNDNTYSPTSGKTNIRSAGSTTTKVCAGSSDASATWTGTYGTADADYCNGCGDPVTISPEIGCTDTILSNGAFDDGITDWELVTDGTVEIEAADGALVATITDEGTTTEINQAPLSVTGSTVYELKVLLAADAAASVGVQLVDDTTPATNRGLNKTIAVGTEPAIYSTQFTASATTTNARLRFNFAATGTVTIYEVCLRAIPSGTITANFGIDDTGGTAPLTINFTDLSTATNTITAWSWRVNGVQFSTSQNPSYTFYAAGTYSIELTVTSSDGSDTLLRSALITVSSSSSSGTGTTTGDMSISVPGGSSDCERRSSGFDLSLSGLRVNVGGSMGIRFVLSEDIPDGATITAVTMTLGMLGPAPSTYPTITIYGQQTDDAAVFSDSTNYDARTWTTATQTWTPAAWTIDATVDLPDLSDIVQELVDDYAGLSSGAGIAFKLAHGGSGDLLKVASYETGVRIPALVIEWEVVGVGGDDVFVGTQTVQIIASANDCERRTAGFDLARAGLRIYPDAGAVAGCGLRFVLAQTIPANATIEAAAIEIWATDAGSTPNDVWIRYEDSAAPVVFSDATDYDARTQSSAYVLWEPTTWPVGTWLETANIATLVQDLVDSYGPLAAGSALVFFLNNEAATAGYMKFFSHESDASLAPKLTIEWSVPVGGVHQTGIGVRAGVGIGL